MNGIVYDPASANYQINRVSMHFWQDENLFGQASRKLGWVITTGNPVRQGHRQRHRAAAADSQEWEATERLDCWALCPHSQGWALDKLVEPYWPKKFQWKQGAGSGATLSSAALLAHTHWNTDTHKAGSDCRHQHHQFFSFIAKLLPKRIFMARVAAKHDGTAPHICSTPSFGNSRSKSLILCGCPLNSIPFLRGSSFTPKWQNSTSTMGQALFPRWNQEVWVGALLYQIGSDWLQRSYYWKKKITHTYFSSS